MARAIYSVLFLALPLFAQEKAQPKHLFLDTFAAEGKLRTEQNLAAKDAETTQFVVKEKGKETTIRVERWYPTAKGLVKGKDVTPDSHLIIRRESNAATTQAGLLRNETYRLTTVILSARELAPRPNRLVEHRFVVVGGDNGDRLYVEFVVRTATEVSPPLPPALVRVIRDYVGIERSP